MLQVANSIINITKKDIGNFTLEKFGKIDGGRLAKAAQILAAIEFSKRLLIKEDRKIRDVTDIVNLSEELKNKKQEYFLTFTLDGANNLIKNRVVFIGTLNRSLVHPREVFADAITDRAAGIIFVHNHLLGNPTPSEEDKMITKRLTEAGNIIGIKVLDHIIISKNGYFSFRAKGLIDFSE